MSEKTGTPKMVGTPLVFKPPQTVERPQESAGGLLPFRAAIVIGGRANWTVP